MPDLAEEVRLLRLQLGELARILAPQGYPYDPAVLDAQPPAPAFDIGATCCGKCPGSTCYVDQVTGA